MIWLLIVLLILSPLIITAWIAYIVFIAIPVAILRWYGSRH